MEKKFTAARELTWDDASSAIVLILEKKGMRFKNGHERACVSFRFLRFPFFLFVSVRARNYDTFEGPYFSRGKKNSTLARCSRTARLNDVERNRGTRTRACIHIRIQIYLAWRKVEGAARKGRKGRTVLTRLRGSNQDRISAVD